MFCAIAHLYKTRGSLFIFFYLLKGKNRVKLIYYFWYSPLFGMRQKTAKNQWNCIVLNFNQIMAYYYSINSKVLSNKEHLIAVYIQPQIISFHFIYVQ